MLEKQLSNPYDSSLTHTPTSVTVDIHFSDNTREVCWVVFWVWWLTPVIPALEKQRQNYHGFIVVICYIVSLTPAWTIGDYCFKNK